MILFIGDNKEYLEELVGEVRNKSYIELKDERFILLKPKAENAEQVYVKGKKILYLEERGRGLLPLSFVQRKKEEEYARKGEKLALKADYVFLARKEI